MMRGRARAAVGLAAIAVLLLAVNPEISASSGGRIETRVWDDALPDALLRRAAAEAMFVFAPGPYVADHQRTRSLWIPLPGDGGDGNGFALQEAVAGLHKLVSAEGGSVVGAAAGAEVWAQVRSGGMAAHYDRD
jgi:hypothetical protein